MKQLMLTLPASVVILSGCATPPPPAPVKQDQPCYAYVDSDLELGLHRVVLDRHPKQSKYIADEAFSADVRVKKTIIDADGNVVREEEEDFHYGPRQLGSAIRNPAPPLKILRAVVESCVASITPPA